MMFKEERKTEEKREKKKEDEEASYLVTICQEGMQCENGSFFLIALRLYSVIYSDVTVYL